jgi:hypothetical protein
MAEKPDPNSSAGARPVRALEEMPAFQAAQAEAARSRFSAREAQGVLDGGLRQRAKTAAPTTAKVRSEQIGAL